MLPYINNQERPTVSKRYEENKHHILAQSMGGTNATENIIKLFLPVHNAYHRIFGTEEIKDAIHQILKINKTALTDEFIHDIHEVIKETDKQYYYKGGIYREKQVFI